MYVGGINPDRETFRLPPVIWSANLRLGFVGCMRDVVLDGRAIDVVDYAQKQDSGKTIGLLYGYIDDSRSVSVLI